MVEIKKVDWDLIKDFAEKEWERFDTEFFGENGKKLQEEMMKDYHFATFDKSGNVIGYIRLKIVGGVGELKDLMVKENMRNQGIGSTLLERFEDFCKEKDCHKLKLFTFFEAPNVEFYKKRGYTIEAVFKNDRMKKEWIIMSKVPEGV